MAINIKNLQERIQKKVFSVSPSTPTADLGDIVEAATLATGSLRQYDSAGLLPSVTSTQAQIAYTKKDNAIKHKSANTTTWKTLTSDAYAAGAAGGSYGNRLASNYGYAAGGRNPGAPTSPTTIDKVSLASDGNATDVGDNPSPIYGGAGVYSDTHGYIAGDGQDNSIWKYAFASDGNSSDTGYDTTRTAPQSLYASGATSQTHGYAMGGAANYNLVVNVIDRFPFSVEANSTDVGDLQAAANFILGNNSSENGYAAGGQNYPGSPTDMIQKFPFASATTNATDTGGNLLTSRPFNDHGQQSETHGYVAGGNPITNVIEKFTFATDGDATDVGDLTITTRWGASASSAAHGYSLGGYAPPGYHNVIQKFSMSSDQNATDVGDLTVNRDLGVGAQY